MRPLLHNRENDWRCSHIFQGEIAKELEVSTDTIIKRYKRLLDSGAIRGSTVVVNPKKIGYKGMTAFMINVSPTHITEKEGSPSESAKILETLIPNAQHNTSNKDCGRL